MITRLRSEKGSFVRSPLKAFETAAAPLTPAGIVDQAEVVAANNAAHSPSFCAKQSNFTAPTGHDIIAFQFSTFGKTPEQMVSGTYTGLTSGATLRPEDNMGGMKHPDSFLCGPSAAGISFYGAGSMVPDFGGAQEIWQWYFSANPGSGAAGDLVQCHANYGRFLTRLPVPGSGEPVVFTPGEQFAFTPDP